MNVAIVKLIWILCLVVINLNSTIRCRKFPNGPLVEAGLNSLAQGDLMTLLMLAGLTLAFLNPVAGADQTPPPTPFEVVPADEAARIDHVVDLTMRQLKNRYPAEKPVLRGVHPKDHGCVTATFKVLETIPKELQVGVFARPGREYPTWIRFSNAAVLVEPDSSTTPDKHGSRGMAIKLMGVEGNRLLDATDPLTQDFLMVNHPVFAFSNVEDYEALSRILLENKDKADRFFAERIHRTADGKPDLTDPMTFRAARTLGIVQRIQSPQMSADPAHPGAYQKPPASPVDNRYFSAAPYLFGPGQVMKYSVRPLKPRSGVAPNTTDPEYLRHALISRLAATETEDVVFDFQVQVRTTAELQGKLETEIEDACVEWDEKAFPFVTVARISIPRQNFDTEDRIRACENLFFTPWHSVAEHQPVGGINRLKLKVYQVSSAFRHFPKEPSGFARQSSGF